MLAATSNSAWLGVSDLAAALPTRQKRVGKERIRRVKRCKIHKRIETMVIDGEDTRKRATL